MELSVSSLCHRAASSHRQPFPSTGKFNWSITGTPLLSHEGCIAWCLVGVRFHEPGHLQLTSKSFPGSPGGGCPTPTVTTPRAGWGQARQGEEALCSGSWSEGHLDSEPGHLAGLRLVLPCTGEHRASGRRAGALAGTSSPLGRYLLHSPTPLRMQQGKVIPNS